MENELNAAEFTEEFNCDRFLCGEYAFSPTFGIVKCREVGKVSNELRIFADSVFGNYRASENGTIDYNEAEITWKMRPAEDDGWIKVVGGVCPEQAKWWKVGEFEVRCKDGYLLTPKSLNVNEIDVSSIVAIRRLDMSTKPQKVDTSAERVQENEKSEHESRRVVIPDWVQTPPETSDDRILDRAKSIPFMPITQNEMMRIAGRALDGMERQRISVEHSVVVALKRNW